MNPNKLKRVIIVHGGAEEREHMMEEVNKRSKAEVMTMHEEEQIRF